MSSDLIEHKGKVTEINEDSIKVDILSKSACASCYAKGSCGIAHLSHKVIEIPKTNLSCRPNDNVTVVMKQTHGYKALWYGFLLPFILLMITLIVTLLITNDESMAGVASLLILIPYYLGLSFFKKQLKDKFKFRIKPSDN